MYVLLWMNTWQPFIFFYQIFFIERIFVFFTPLSFLFFLFSSLHCHSRLHKTILKILSIYRKNILGKQLSQVICSKYVVRVLHAPKFQIWSKQPGTYLNQKQLLVFYEKAAMMNFIRKLLYFNKVSCLQPKERPLHRCFFVSFTKYIKTFSLAKLLWVTAPAKYPFLFVTSNSATKNVSFDLGYFNMFKPNIVNRLRTALCGSSGQSALTNLIYC